MKIKAKIYHLNINGTACCWSWFRLSRMNDEILWIDDTISSVIDTIRSVESIKYQIYDPSRALRQTTQETIRKSWTFSLYFLPFKDTDLDQLYKEKT